MIQPISNPTDGTSRSSEVPPRQDGHGASSVPNSPIHEVATVREKRTGFAWHHAILLAVILGGTAAFVLFRHASAESNLVDATKKMAVPSVRVARPKISEDATTLTLPGNVQAHMESPLYARVNGYLRKWYVDIGAQVKEGQLLAEIDTPEIDQQLNQARAGLVQVEADLKLAQITSDRWKNLLKDKAVSQQETDEKSSALEVKKADWLASQANVKRLEELQSFQKVYAPFTGIVTARKTDVGNLIAAGSGNSAQELFRVAAIGTLRIYVNVPESYSSAVAPGVSAKIEMATTPGQPVMGKIVRTAGAIDPESHTMLTEIEVPNPDGKLLPGGYAQVHFEITPKNPPLVIPAITLIFRAQGAQVAVVDANNKVKLTPIKIGRDFGTSLEVVQGISANDSLILNPSDSLADGESVQIEAKADGAK